MHLLSGVIKALTRCIQQWTANHGNKASFIQYASLLLDPIQELQLPWCKTPSYTGGKLPGWVSENYISLARVSKWFYSGVEELTTDQPFVEPFDLPQSKWLKEHNVGWLNARGIDSTGSAVDVRKHVAEEMVNPNGPLV